MLIASTHLMCRCSQYQKKNMHAQYYLWRTVFSLKKYFRWRAVAIWDETPIWMPASVYWPSLGDKSNDILKQCLTRSSERGVRTALHVCVCVCVCAGWERTEHWTPVMPRANMRGAAMPAIFPTHLYQHLLRPAHTRTYTNTNTHKPKDTRGDMSEC